jgi:hypothetical protein
MGRYFFHSFTSKLQQDGKHGWCGWQKRFATIALAAQTTNLSSILYWSCTIYTENLLFQIGSGENSKNSKNSRSNGAPAEQRAVSGELQGTRGCAISACRPHCPIHTSNTSHTSPAFTQGNGGNVFFPRRFFAKNDFGITLYRNLPKFMIAGYERKKN